MILFEKEHRPIVVLTVPTFVFVVFGRPWVMLFVLLIAMGWAFEGANGDQYLTMMAGVGLAGLVPTGLTVRAFLQAARPAAESAFRAGEMVSQGGHVNSIEAEQEGSDGW